MALADRPSRFSAPARAALPGRTPAVWTGCPAMPRLPGARGGASFAVPPSPCAPIHERGLEAARFPRGRCRTRQAGRSRYSCGPAPPDCQEAAPQGSRCLGRPATGAALGGDGAGSLGGARTARVPVLADCSPQLCLAKLLLITLRHRRAREPADPASARAASSCPGRVHSATVCAERRRGLWLLCISEHPCGRGAKSDG